MGNKASKLIEHNEEDNSSGQHISSHQNPEPSLHENGLPIRKDNRYRASSILASNGVQHVVWLEDFLALKGSNIMVWDLSLLVQNPVEAAVCLSNLGYQRTAPEARFQHDPEITKSCIRLLPLASTETAVVLLPAQDWYYDIFIQGRNPLPPLHLFLDSMMEFWLNISSKDYIDRLEFALYIAALIEYCYALTDEDGVSVKTVDYAERLRVEQRELHYDILDGKQNYTHTARHRYHAQKYREIRAGFFTPIPYDKDGYRPQLGTLAEI